jgi:voltage-gated potassium channel Kch
MADVVLVLAAAAAVAGLFFPTHTAGRGIVVFTASFLYFLAPLSIVRHLAFRAEVDQETVLGAVAAYLFFGMFFAFAYRTIGILQPGPFFGANGEGTMSQDLFFSFITLTTTGYGNLVPARNPGQTFAVVEALVGQLFLVTAVAKVVSAWRPKRLRIPPEPESGPDEPGTA